MKRRRFKRVKISKLTKFSFLPSIFTIFNLFVGFLALLLIIKGNYKNAVYLLMISAVLDAFDGTIARLTKTESNFGMHLDSLVDAVSFGLVTSVLIYMWGFQEEVNQIGKVIGFVFLSAGIIRLSRFNVLKEAGAFSSEVFIGLPIPLASISVCSIVLILEKPLTDKMMIIYFSIFVIFISFLMISNIKYRSLKNINSKYNLLILFLLAIAVAFIIMYPRYTIPILTFLYILSPFFFFLPKKFRKRHIISEDDTSVSIVDP